MRRNMVGPKRGDAMLGFALVAKGLTILGPLLVVVIYNCEHEEEGDTERYWQRKIKLWAISEPGRTEPVRFFVPAIAVSRTSFAHYALSAWLNLALDGCHARRAG
jgi:hypothetical protein